VAFDASGTVLAKANRDGREETLLLDVTIPTLPRPPRSAE